MNERTAQELFDAALQAVKVGISVLPEPERSEGIKVIVALCHRVAGVSGGLARFLGLSAGIANEEQLVLDAIGAKLRA